MVGLKGVDFSKVGSTVELLGRPTYQPNTKAGYPIFDTNFDEETDLFPFQRDDVDYLSNVLESGSDVALNFNEMGLGKTREAIGIANRMKKSRILVVCPKSLMLNWKKEIEMLDGNPVMVAKPQTYKKFQDFLENFYTTRWFIINVDVLRRREFNQFMFMMGFDLVIFDEAHHMRNMEKAAKARGARDFFRVYFNKSTSFEGEVRQKHALFMTGSPVVNEATDMFAYFQFLEPERFPNFKTFKYSYCRVVRGYKSDKAKGFLNPELITSLIAAKGVQHKKSEVAKELPPKIANIIPLEMDDDQRDMYNIIENELVYALDNGEPLHAPEVLQKLIRLRQISSDPALVGSASVSSAKTAFFADFVEGIGDEPFVVFSAFEQYVTILCEVLKKKGVTYARITGKEDGFQRARNVDKFQNGQVQAIIGTIQSGGEGITLTRASNVLLMDRWWTPAANSQAVDRLHRFGQEADQIMIHIPQCIASVDQYMDIILEEKQNLIDSVVVSSDVQAAVLEMMKKNVGRR